MSIHMLRTIRRCFRRCFTFQSATCLPVGTVRNPQSAIFILFLAFCLAAPAQAATITQTITHGATTINMDFVIVGNPGNTADDTTYGAVDYDYLVGQYEVTADQWEAVRTADSDVGNACLNTGAQPAGSITWHEAAKFANWLTSGSYDVGYYTITGGVASVPSGVSHTDYAAANPSYARVYFIPTENEWYKAAYYDPNKSGGAGYWDYPTGSDTKPTAEAPPGTDMVNGSANFNAGLGGPTDVGSYTYKPSDSPYGTFDQGGNIMEWTEAGDFNRIIRGGTYVYIGLGDQDGMNAAYRAEYGPQNEYPAMGFRVSALPGVPAVIGITPDAVVLDTIIVGGSSSKDISAAESAGVAGTYNVGTPTGNFSVAGAPVTDDPIAGSATDIHAVTYADTSIIGAQSGSVEFSDGSSGTVTDSPKTVALSGLILAHSDAKFVVGTGGTQALSSGDNALLIDFGSVAPGAGGGELFAGFSVLNYDVGAGYTAALDLDHIESGYGDENELILEELLDADDFYGLFENKAAGDDKAYTILFDTTAAPGDYETTYFFKLSDENLSGATPSGSEILTLTVQGTVTPEPATLALVMVGGLGMLLARNRK